MPLFKIADLVLEISGIDNEFFNKRFAEYRTRDNREPSIKVIFADEKFMPEGKLVTVADGFRQYYSGPDGYGVFDLLKAPDEYCARLAFDREIKTAKANISDISAYGGMTDEVRSFNMLGELFRYFILKHDGLVLHSSCIKYKNAGIAFSAPSGTGKSTHTGLWKRYFPNDVTILNDDSPAIRFDEFGVGVFGTPWSGKTDINANDGAPLAAIVVLEQSPENSIDKLSVDEALFRILQEVTRPVFPDFINLTLSAVEKLLLHTPVYRLKCNISEEAVLTVKNKLEL
ncbi:MAG: hypothetical protein WCX81_07500 [Monoglobales bacterium]